MNNLNTFVQRVSPLTYGIAVVALALVLILMTLRILSRNLGLGLTGLQLYAQASGVWMVFIVAGSLGLEGRHIEINYVSQRLPESVKPYHEILLGVINIAMCGVIVVGSVLAMREFWTGTSPSVNIPLPLYYVPAFVGLTLLGLVYISQTGTALSEIRG